MRDSFCSVSSTTEPNGELRFFIQSVKYKYLILFFKFKTFFKTLIIVLFASLLYLRASLLVCQCQRNPSQVRHPSLIEFFPGRCLLVFMASSQKLDAFVSQNRKFPSMGTENSSLWQGCSMCTICKSDARSVIGVQHIFVQLTF